MRAAASANIYYNSHNGKNNYAQHDYGCRIHKIHNVIRYPISAIIHATEHWNTTTAKDQNLPNSRRIAAIAATHGV